MYRFYIEGIVQGVGFRPYIYNACVTRGVQGYVMNVGTGVVIVADHREVVEDILHQIPALARVDRVEVSETDEQCTGFVIRESEGNGHAEIPSDLYLCDDCLRELHDPTNRRYGYFFTTCTNCGPRYTTTRKSPYDRRTTSMDVFAMCDACRTEYEDPHNRRYHAQTIACHTCGPQLRLLHEGRMIAEGTGPEVIQRAVAVLSHGDILAIKGVGGFHLACTTLPEAVRALKNYTGRTDKPFALLCKDSAMVERIAQVSAVERRVLESIERPIVILEKRVPLPEVTELASVGVMLPSTALQYLLFDHIDEPLVMTSSNRSGEPISLQCDEQWVPWILSHTRDIVHAVDDSLIKVIDGEPLLVRRSRGYVPRSLSSAYGRGTESILACGAEMNSTFALYANGRTTLSPYLGTTANPDSLARYKHTVQSFLDVSGIQPEIVCTDLHPDFATTHAGIEYAHTHRARHLGVQHHVAHAYSVAFEHNLHEFTAIICDGMGYGPDGTIWGGEILHNDTRIGHLETHLQLGGDSAALHPGKMAYSILRSFLSHDDAVQVLGAPYTGKEYALLKVQWDEALYSPQTSSCGRVLDAASALLGFCTERTYEGRPALLLESYSTEPYVLEPVIDGTILRTAPLFAFLVQNMHKDRGRLAATVTEYLAEGLYAVARQYDRPILFGGGCAYNTRMASCMRAHGVLMNREIPPGDGGISMGQVAYARMKN